VERLNLSDALEKSKTLIQSIEQESGVSLKDCYQCGKCSAGCPVAFAFDYTPRQIIRLLQLGLADEALKAHAPWLCASCEACYTRCPREVDLPALMETLRMEGKKRGLVPEKTVDLFNGLFLDSVRKNGRVHEMGMILQYNLRSGQFFKDAFKAPKLLLDGKIGPVPEKIQGVAAVERIFARTMAKGDESN